MQEGEEVPTDLMCPITRAMINTAVISSDGFTYESTALQEWLNNKSVSPMIGTRLEGRRVTANKSMNCYLEVYKGLTQRMVARKQKLDKAQQTIVEQVVLSDELKKRFDQVIAHYYKSTLDLKECIIEMKAIYDLAPHHFDIALNYANMLRFGGRCAEAINIVKDLRHMRPSSAIPPCAKVRIISEMGKKEEASRRYIKLQRRLHIPDLTFVEIRFLCYSMLSVGLRTAAEQFITTYISVVPQDQRALSHHIYLRLLNQDYRSVIKLSRDYLRIYNDDISIMFHQAKSYKVLSKPSKAKAIYEQIAKLSLDRTLKARALYYHALLLDGDAEFPTVVAELEEAHRLDPMEEADICLASKYYNKDLFKKAQEWLDITAQRPNVAEDKDYLKLKARLEERQPDIGNALSTYLKLAEIDPENGYLYNNKVEDLLNKESNPPPPSTPDTISPIVQQPPRNGEPVTPSPPSLVQTAISSNPSQPPPNVPMPPPPGPRPVPLLGPPVPPVRPPVPQLIHPVSLLRPHMPPQSHPFLGPPSGKRDSV